MNTEHWHLTKPSCTGTGGMVASQHALATNAGAAQLLAGGNAVDAALAAALALGVVEPWMCGLGGSGLMTIWLAGEQRAHVIDFQGVLAAGSRAEDYPVDPDLPATLMGFPTVRGSLNVQGYRSVTVPGAAAGFDLAARLFGNRSRTELAAPAIALAGVRRAADWFTTLQTALAMPTLRTDAASAGIYLPDGCPLPPERPWIVPGLANTLESWACGGAEDFYRGELAERIVADLQRGGSLIDGDDLAAYEALLCDASLCTHRGATLYTPGETSGGGRLAEMLSIIASELPAPPPAPTPATWVLYANALEAAWHSHRARRGRVTEVGSCTSHLSTVDSAGNMVALTHTLLNRFGSGVTLPATGLLMNNAVSYFDPRPGFTTSLAPCRRINSSNMCPTVAVRDGQSLFALGASGGNQIMPAVTQVAALMLDFDMGLAEAMHTPRIDSVGSGSLRADPRLGDEVLRALGSQHDMDIAEQCVFPKLYACVSGVARTPPSEAGSGECTGLNDPSLPSGSASGPAAFDPPAAPAPLVDVRA